MLNTQDLENILTAVTPKMVQHITALLDITPEDWDKLDDRVRARHIVDFQQRGLLAATLSASAKAHTDLEAAAHPITEKAEAHTKIELLNEQVAALTELVEGLIASQKKARR